MFYLWLVLLAEIEKTRSNDLYYTKIHSQWMFYFFYVHFIDKKGRRNTLEGGKEKKPHPWHYMRNK